MEYRDLIKRRSIIKQERLKKSLQVSETDKESKYVNAMKSISKNNEVAKTFDEHEYENFTKDEEDDSEYEDIDMFSFKNKGKYEIPKLTQNDIEKMTQNCVIVPQKYYNKINRGNEIRILLINNDLVFGTLNGVFSLTGYPYISLKRKFVNGTVSNQPIPMHKISRIYKKLAPEALVELVIIGDVIDKLKEDIETLKKENTALKVAFIASKKQN